MDICKIGSRLAEDRKMIRALVNAQKTASEVGCDGIWYELERLIQEYSNAHTAKYKAIFENMNLAEFCEIADSFKID